MIALFYFVGSENPCIYSVPNRKQSYDYCVNAIDTKRTDMETMRGIRVGATREDVLKAYPEIYDSHYWNDTDPDFPGADYLWYCDNEDGWGAAILFFFDGDIVSQICLNNMFN